MQNREKIAVSNINAQMAAANLANQIIFADKKIADLKASSPTEIIGQLKNKKAPKEIAKNITSLFDRNYNKERAEEIAGAMIDSGTDTKEMAEIYKDLSSGENKKRFVDALKENNLSDFKVDKVKGTDLAIEYSYPEKKNLEKIDYVSAHSDYEKATLGEMLKNKRILSKGSDSQSLKTFNDELKKKYEQFKEKAKVADKSEAYNNERFYSLLRDDKTDFGNGTYFVSQLLRLPASSAGREILTEYLDNIENAKNDIVQKKLLEHYLYSRKFTIHSSDRAVNEDQDERIKIAQLLLNRGGIATLDSNNAINNFMQLSPNNKDILIKKIGESNRNEFGSFSNALVGSKFAKDLENIVNEKRREFLAKDPNLQDIPAAQLLETLNKDLLPEQRIKALTEPR